MVFYYTNMNPQIDVGTRFVGYVATDLISLEGLRRHLNFGLEKPLSVQSLMSSCGELETQCSEWSRSGARLVRVQREVRT